jgi:hypothetical protein
MRRSAHTAESRAEAREVLAGRRQGSGWTLSTERAQKSVFAVLTIESGKPHHRRRSSESDSRELFS